jgi:hypothetical protein
VNAISNNNAEPGILLRPILPRQIDDYLRSTSNNSFPTLRKPLGALATLHQLMDTTGAGSFRRVLSVFGGCSRSVQKRDRVVFRDPTTPLRGLLPPHADGERALACYVELGQLVEYRPRICVLGRG